VTLPFDPRSEQPEPRRDAPDPDGFVGGLNERQREAVTHGDGPVLVLAGAGSGKTRVITQRIAWLVRVRRVEPWAIVAVTFTNKAAGEMRDRVARLLHGDGRTGAWIGTFHALCLRILRRDGARIGLEPGFNIYDTDDQLTLVRGLLKEESQDPTIKARAVLSRISRAKNAMESAETLERRAFTPEQRLTARIHARYDEALRRSNAVDFDDLLLRALELFREHPAVLREYAERCRHLLVDEYQDTNRPQYLLVRALTSVHGNLFVVGDEDQSIYRFRGAEIRNILDFETDHPGATTIRLEQNYRSTGTILAVAGAVIANNVRRKGKTLWTENEPGERALLFRAPDDRAEAVWVAERVREIVRNGDPADVAVLYRTNAQSRQFEEIFRRERIPFHLVGSVQFYERKEVKDLLAYLKLLANPADDVAFGRAVNTPPRGIGDGTLGAVEDAARRHGVPMLEAVGWVLEHGALATRAATSLRRFADLFADLLATAEAASVEATLDAILERTTYEAYLEKAYPGQGDERMDNVRALVSAAAEYWEEEAAPSLLGFLDRSALVSDADEVGRGEGVTLMTIHNAKGLEFPYVFLAGLEENLFPHVRSVGSDDDLEEERRLCYVAMTRARRRLALSYAGVRRVQGQFAANLPSRFLDEIPGEFVEDVTPSLGPLWERPPSWEPASRPGNGSAALRAAARAAAARPAPPGPSLGAVEISDDFRVGRRVQHPKFGAGEIVAREGSGRGLKLTIRFRDHGAKKILPSYTKLRVEA